MTKDERARAIIEEVLRRGWPQFVQSVRVTPRIDFLDEPALDVLVELKSINQVPASIARGDMLARLDDALAEGGDGRGAHIAFSAPDEEHDLEAAETEELKGAGR